MNAALLETAKATGVAMAADCNKLTQNWSNPAEFVSTVQSKGRGENITVTVVPADPDSLPAKKFGWLDLGTKDHDVPPKPGGVLVFNVPYVPATRPNSLFVGSSKTGSTVVFTKKTVTVSGIKPRNWSKLLQKKWQPQFKLDMAGAMTLARKVSENEIVK